MKDIQHKKFRTQQDWYEFLSTKWTLQDLRELRKSSYKKIEKYRKRPLLVYATKFLGNLPFGNIPNFIDLSDVDGFTDLVNSIDKNSEIDVLIHSPGGKPDATERIVKILRNKFSKISFLIPHSAYSAATMLALSGDEVILHPSATLGPIDPQINGIPARSITNGFEKVKERIAKEGAETLPAYIPLIEKYSLELLELCEDSEKLSKKLTSEWLKKFMFKGKSDNTKIAKAVSYFSDYDKHLMHSRPISLDKLHKFGLKITLADESLSELLWESYILLNGLFNVTTFVKLYENSENLSWGHFFEVIQSNIHGNKK